MAPEHLTDQEIAEYARGQASPEALLVCDDHLAGCADCRSRLGALSPAAGILNWRENITDVEQERRHLAYELLVAPAAELHTDGQEHLRQCDSCREEMAELSARRQPQPIRKAPQSWKWLAPLAAVAAVAAIFFLWKPAAPPPRPAALAEIHDAGGLIALRADRVVEAPPSVPAADRPLLAQVLETGALPLAPTPADVQSKNGTLLGPATADAFAPLAPAGVLVLSDRPEFRWQPIPAGADWYRVQVYDSDFNEVAASDKIAQTAWTPVEPLPRGRLYQWQITARTQGKEVRVPAPPAKEARFRVLDAAAATKIESARAASPVSHLLLAVLCAQAGLRDEARAELDRLGAENPSSALVAKLTASLR